MNQFNSLNTLDTKVSMTVCLFCIYLLLLSRPREPNGREHKPARRVVWQFIHSALGHSAVWLALCNICLGVYLILAHTVIWIVWYAYLGLLVLVFAISEWVSTYRNRRAARLSTQRSSSRKYVLHSDNTSIGQRHGDAAKGFDNPAMMHPDDTVG